MSEIEPRGYEALAPALVAAVFIAAGGVYFILDRAAPILANSAPVPAAALKPAGDHTQVPSAQPTVQAAVQSGPAVYRCKVNGTTTYSDTPCPGATVVDARPAAGGFVPTSLRRQATVVQTITEPPPVQVGAVTANEKTKRDARCAWIEREIERIDALARQGQTAATQDRLREERRKLVDEKYDLKC
jgi:hypothetical protein